MTTFCPALPMSKAMALPNPREDPVTKTTLAVSSSDDSDMDKDVDGAEVIPCADDGTTGITKAELMGPCAKNSADKARNDQLLDVNMMAL